MKVAEPRHFLVSRMILVLLSFFIGCSSSQQARTLPVTYYPSSFTCNYCKMFFQDQRFGGALELTSDSTLVFDATECMVAYLLSHNIQDAQIKAIWSVDYAHPTLLGNAREMFYLHSDKVPSPMEMNIAAFASRDSIDAVRSISGGTVADWNGAVLIVKNRWGFR